MPRKGVMLEMLESGRSQRLLWMLRTRVLGPCIRTGDAAGFNRAR